MTSPTCWGWGELCVDLANLEEQLVGHHLQPPTLLPSLTRWEGSGNQESLGSSEHQRSDRGFLPTPGNFLLPDTTPASLMGTTLEPPPRSQHPHSTTPANGGWAPLRQPSPCCAPHPRPGSGQQLSPNQGPASLPPPFPFLLCPYLLPVTLDPRGLCAVSYSVSPSLRTPLSLG